MKSDLELSQSAQLKEIYEIAAMAGIHPDEVIPHGQVKAKISLSLLKRTRNRRNGKVILVTAMTPTSSGEGKTTVAIGLSEGLNHIGERSIVCLREPSIGPIMGMKGKGTGAGRAQVVPMEDINLHFTGDIGAVSAAGNLLASMIDNSIWRGNPARIDSNTVVWRRCLDMNDRELRHAVVGVGDRTTGITRSERFVITAASEVMAILCLARDPADLKRRLGNIVTAYDVNGKPVLARQVNAQGAMAALLAETIKPNLVQTMENTPAFVHGGPFANIAHGTSSLMALYMARKLTDYVVIEAGFGSDLGAEKFFNITSRLGNFKPDAVVLVVTIKALKRHGGIRKKELGRPDTEAVLRGIPNMLAHVQNIRKHGFQPIIALNRFTSDTEEEIEVVRNQAAKHQLPFAVADVYALGGKGGAELARSLVANIRKGAGRLRFLYPLNMSLENKIGTIVREVYGLSRVNFTRRARRQIEALKEHGFGNLPVCMAKTPFSLSNNPKLLGVPDPSLSCSITELFVSAGAGFIVAATENINLMPGLPKRPLAEKLDIDEDGWIKGLD